MIEDYTNRWHIIEENHVKEDHINKQYMTWNINTKDHIRNQYMTENNIVKDHDKGCHITDITVIQ